jgi:ABC-type amino acid transport substrate-binding protein
MKNSYKNIFGIKNLLKLSLISLFSLSIPISSSYSEENASYLNNIVDADGSLKRVTQAGVLRVGADPNIGLPFIKKESFGFSYKGFEYEISNHIAEQLGCKVKIIPTNWQNLITGLEEKKYDIVISTMEKPEDNKESFKNIGFSVPYFTNSQHIVVNRDNNEIKFLNHLKGKKVGVLNESISKILISEINKIQNAGITMVMYTNTKDLFNSLQKKLITAVIVDTPIASWNCQDEKNDCKLGGLPIFPKNYVIAVRKQDRALLNGIDSILKESKKNTSIARILEKWNLN